MKMTKLLIVAAVSGLFCSQTYADLIDLRLDGSWTASTVATGEFNAVSQSPGISNSVTVASISTMQARQLPSAR